VPEGDAFISHMSGVRFVRYMAELSGLPPQPALERAHEAFFYVGLGEARYRKLGTYSLGMKQLAKLAQAIAHGPRLLLLDEPTSGLDPQARQRMIRLIREIRDVEGMYLLISSHLLPDVEETCEEVLILKDGRIAAHCDLEAERRSNRRFVELETVGTSPAFAVAVQGLGCECAFYPDGQGIERVKLVLPEAVSTARAHPPGRPAPGRDPAYELPARLARGHLPRRHEGERRHGWRSIGRSYRPYAGPLTSERWRFLVVSRYALQELVESRVLMAFVVMCLLPFLAEAVGIYVANSAPARALLRIAGGPDPMSAEFFAGALTVQGTLAFVLTAWVAPVLVSPDLVNGALPLYLSRPFARAEYLLGKAVALATLLSLITWVPGLVLFALQAGLAESDWALTHLRVAWATLVGSCIWIAVLTLVGLSFSAWIRWRLVASAALFAVFFMGSASRSSTARSWASTA
jgi:energy-coupling factor transporter ATP-binding protein EcfA2/ABC-type transport system involved in multi-copper enzyme maturation permease subunit